MKLGTRATGSAARRDGREAPELAAGLAVPGGLGLGDGLPPGGPGGGAEGRAESARILALDAERLFRALTSREVSRNKAYGSFTYDGYRRVHRRYRVVRAIQAEAERLADVPGSWCRVATRAGVLQVRLESPRLQYRREVALLPYEWEWLEEQTGIRSLLAAAAAQGSDARRLLP